MCVLFVVLFHSSFLLVAEFKGNKALTTASHKLVTSAFTPLAEMVGVSACCFCSHKDFLGVYCCLHIHNLHLICPTSCMDGTLCSLFVVHQYVHNADCDWSFFSLFWQISSVVAPVKRFAIALASDTLSTAMIGVNQVSIHCNAVMRHQTFFPTSLSSAKWANLSLLNFQPSPLGYGCVCSSRF